ncbi:MAG: PPC domain-containing protein [Ignavibacteria bacterium]|nr:PPC domain-containing protein [Ignavibacteria bacterium]
MKACLLIFILIFTSCNNSNTKIEKLSPGKVVNQLLKKGEKFQYTVDLNKGEYFEMTVMQKGIDLYVTIFDQGGKALKTFDSYHNPNGPERVKFVSPGDGQYKIEITTLPEEQNNSVNKSETIDQGEFEINSVRILTSSEYSNLPEEKTDQQNIVSIFKAHAHPLKV